MDLRKKRLEKQMTQADVAAKVGISQGRYSDIENGKSTQADTARKIAAVLGFDWWLLFEDGDEKEEK